MYYAKYSEKTWNLILHALETYVIERENELKTKNVGDSEWNELFDYNDLIHDIKYYVLPPSDS